MVLPIDLPEPDGPMMALNRPCSNATVTLAVAITAFCPSPYTLVASTALAALFTVGLGGTSTSVALIRHLSSEISWLLFRGGPRTRLGCQPKISPDQRLPFGHEPDRDQVPASDGQSDLTPSTSGGSHLR